MFQSNFPEPSLSSRRQRQEKRAKTTPSSPGNWALISQFLPPFCGASPGDLGTRKGHAWLYGGAAPTPAYLVGVDNGEEPGEQAAEEGHQHGLHHVVLGQGPGLGRGRGWHTGHGAVVLWGWGPRRGKATGLRTAGWGCSQRGLWGGHSTHCQRPPSEAAGRPGAGQGPPSTHSSPAPAPPACHSVPRRPMASASTHGSAQGPATGVSMVSLVSPPRGPPSSLPQAARSLFVFS